MHEWEELKQGVWLEPIQAMLRRKTDEAWTDKHRNILRKLVVEGGSVQKRLFDTGWSDEKEVLEAVTMKKARNSIGCVPLSVVERS